MCKISKPFTCCILITCAMFLDFLKGCFGSFVGLEWMELIASISRANDKVRAGFYNHNNLRCQSSSRNFSDNNVWKCY